MNLFVSSDLYFNNLIIYRLEKDFAEIKTDEPITILTTDREQDKPFVSFALMKGLDFKIYNIKDFCTDEIMRKVSLNIDFLLIYSNMGNTMYRTLYKYCNETIRLGSDRYYLNEVKAILYMKYQERQEARADGQSTLTEYEVYKQEYLDVVNSLQGIPIKIHNELG